MADDPIDAEPETDPGSEPDAPAEDAVDAGDEVETATTDDGPSSDTKPATPVVRRKVVSKRVTPKGGGAGVKATSSGPATKAKRNADDDDVSFASTRYTPPSSRADAQLPSPWWVPALMFAFLIVGALVIMLNYMGVFGDAENYRLIIGLGLILAGIVTATQYR